MSAAFDLYLARESWLHRLDPRPKLWAVLLAAVAALAYRHLAALALLLLLSHLVLVSARVPVRRLLWLWARLVPLLVMILLLQPFFSPGAGADLLRLGPLRITTEGLLMGFSFALRAAVLAFSAAVLLLSTDMNRLVDGLVRLGLPYPWGLTVGLSIRYLPTTYGLFTAIGEAQQARGWLVREGGLLRRLRSYLPILVATIIGALRLSDSLGLALAARGLGYARKRTSLYVLAMAPADWVFVGFVTLLFAGGLFVRFGLGFGAAPW